MIDIAGKQIIPAVIKYVTSLAQSVNSVKSAVADADVSVQSELLTELSLIHISVPLRDRRAILQGSLSWMQAFEVTAWEMHRCLRSTAAL